VDLSNQDKPQHLKDCPLFVTSSEDEVQAIESSAEMYELGKNQDVPAPPGDEPSLYVVKNGHAQLTYTDAEGNEAVVILLGPGDVFGSLDPASQGFTEHCRTISEACVFRISRQNFDWLLQRYPQLAFRLTRFSLNRINRLQARLADFMIRKADERLALALLDLNQQVGREEADGRRKLSLPLTHGDLGKLIGTSREMVTILFTKFREAGLISTEKGWIYLRDLENLKKLASRQE